MELPLFDICESRHGGSETSIEANRKVDKAGDRQRVVEAFQKMGGKGYSKQIARILHKPLNSLSGRLSELLAMGILEKTEDRAEGCAILRLKK